jgi:hypothetical protein
MFFGGFLRQSNYDRKKSTVVWPLVGMFGGSMSLDCFSGFLDQITTEKKVQLSGHWLQCRIVLAGSLLCFSAGSSIKLQITTGKKGTVIWPLVGMSHLKQALS